MTIGCSIQARMGSSRFPGKVLHEIASQPMIGHQIDRLRRCKKIDKIIVATTTSKSDDALAAYCIEKGVTVFRGDENDVLKRIAEMVHQHEIDIHIECFGDSPLVDPAIIDQFIGIYSQIQSSQTVVTNTFEQTYPAGLEVNVYAGELLLAANQRMSPDDPLREHVGFNVIRNASPPHIINIVAPANLSRPDIFLEVDEEADLKVVGAVVEHFGANLPTTQASEILAFLDSTPSLSKENINIHRRWKTVKRDHLN